MPRPLRELLRKATNEGGYSDNPNVQSFLQGTISLRTQRSVAINPTRGNCKRGLAFDDPKVDNTPLKKRRKIERSQKSDTIMHC